MQQKTNVSFILMYLDSILKSVISAQSPLAKLCLILTLSLCEFIISLVSEFVILIPGIYSFVAETLIFNMNNINTNSGIDLYADIMMHQYGYIKYNTI